MQLRGIPIFAQFVEISFDSTVFRSLIAQRRGVDDEIGVGCWVEIFSKASPKSPSLGEFNAIAEWLDEWPNRSENNEAISDANNSHQTTTSRNAERKQNNHYSCLENQPRLLVMCWSRVVDFVQKRDKEDDVCPGLSWTGSLPGIFLTLRQNLDGQFVLER